MNCQKVQKFIDMNFSENDFLDSFEDNDPNFNQLDELFSSLIGPELNKISQIQAKFNTVGEYIIKKQTIEEFLIQLHNISCPKILKYINVIRQCYFLYIFSILLIRYNDEHLKLSKEEFIEKIYFKNILNVCSKYLVECKRLLFRLIRKVYKEMENQSNEVLDFYFTLYRSNESLIRNEMLYHFLISLVSKFNPLIMEDVEETYSSVFRRILYFYIKAKTSGLTDLEVSSSFINDNNTISPSERYQIYEDALYFSQIQSLCTSSNDIEIISKQYDNVKSSVLPNELQRLYLFALENGKFVTNNDKIALFRIHEELDNMDDIKSKIPHVFRLLRSIHIKSESPMLLEHDIAIIREIIYNTLNNRFSHILSDDSRLLILKNIAENLIKSLTVGEFLDMMTLTKVNISGEKFTKQLQLFLEHVLPKINSTEGDSNG